MVMIKTELCFIMFDRLCPCGSNNNYSACCGKYHHDHCIADIPETLMRSRYTAYTMSNMAYIKKTMQGKPLVTFNEDQTLHWAKSICWLSLEVVKSQYDNIDKTRGYVEFIAKYLDGNMINTIHEISEFKYNDSHWYYVDGKQGYIPAIKISRNSPCPCGSSKKIKHCHAIK